MQKQTKNKWAKRVLIAVFAVMIFNVSAPITVFAAEPPPLCKSDGSDPQTCKKVDKCPDTYIESGENCTKKASSSAFDESTLGTIKFLAGLQTLANKMIWPILVMTGELIDNSLLFGNGMETRLREIWIPIRNIVNILFVIALLGIAIYNVLGISDENSTYSIKAVLPKLIIGIIAVNFSFLGIKIFLDGINVLTSAIFALPNEISSTTASVLNPDNPTDKSIIDKFCRSMDGKEFGTVIDSVKEKKEADAIAYLQLAQSEKYKAKLPNVTSTTTIDEIKGMMSGWTAEEKANFETEAAKLSIKFCEPPPANATEDKDKFVLNDTGKLFLRRWNSKNSALAMAIGLGRIVYYKEIDVSDINDVEKLFVNSALSLMMYLLYLASFIALFVVLLGRLVVMWLAIALSPVLLLTIAVPVIKEKLSGFGEITTQFVKNAIAPLGIALSLTIGWIMLKAIQGVNGLSNGESTINFSASAGIPVVGLTTLQDLVVGVGTIAVIWLGVFSAASESIAAPVTDAMKAGLKTAGTFLGTMPLKHAPIFHIDVDGDAGDDDNFTGTQIQRAIQNLGAAKDPDKMVRKLNGPQINDQTLNSGKVTDSGTLHSYLADANVQKGIKAKDPAYIAAFEKFKDSDVFKTKISAQERDKINKYLELAKNPDANPKDLENATKKLIDLSTGATPLQPDQKGKPATTPAKESPTGVQQDIKYGDDAPLFIQRKLQKEEAEEVTEARGALISELDSDKPKAGKISTNLTALIKSIPAEARAGASADSLLGKLKDEKFLSKEAYKILLDKGYGGNEANLKAELQTLVIPKPAAAPAAEPPAAAPPAGPRQAGEPQAGQPQAGQPQEGPPAE